MPFQNRTVRQSHWEGYTCKEITEQHTGKGVQRKECNTTEENRLNSRFCKQLDRYLQDIQI